MRDGSSPRVRGMLIQAATPLIQVRIIPACAGNARPARRPRPWSPDHPRVCGECLSTANVSDDTPGSSPRVRGMPCRVRRPLRRGRIIPACAGNATPVGTARVPSQDHPRVCGECEHIVTVARFGDRIIPACAGNARRQSSRPAPSSDHPRVCGECHRIPDTGLSWPGSSPRVRGMRCAEECRRPCEGIIPACAGNASVHPDLRTTHGDHPRVCGECLAADGRVDDVLGSSPRVRGMRSRSCATTPSTRDHPRVCGECGLTTAQSAFKQGSSPRVRGMLRHRLSVRRFGRIIPACAGNATPGSP